MAGRSAMRLGLLALVLAACETEAPTDPVGVHYRVRRAIGEGELSDPMGVAVHRGRILVADTGNARIARFALDGTPDGELEARDLELVRPFDVAVSSDGAIWIADFGADAVFRVADGAATRAVEVRAPAGLDVTGERPLVAAFYDHTIVGGEARLGREGSGEGELHYPTDVLRGADGHLYVADSYNHRVQILDSRGRFTRALGGDGETLNVPVDMVLQDQVLHIADSGHHRVVAVDARTGALLGELAIGDGGGEQQHTPSRIALHDGRLLVVDPAGDRVLELTMSRR